MKVHHILSETLDLKQIDGLWRIWDTVKKSAVGIGFETQGAAEEARDRLRTQRVSVPTSSAPTGDTPSLSSGVRPGTPTSDTLSRGEKRRLSRRGTISRNGVTYTVANINAADAELKLKVQPLSVDNNTPGNKKIDGDWLAKAKEGAAKSFKSKAFQSFGKLLQGTALTKIQAIFNAMVLEETLDAYLRAVREWGTSLDANDSQGVSNFQKAEAGDKSAVLPPKVKAAYVESVRRSTELVIEGVVGLVLTGGAAFGLSLIPIIGFFGVSTGGLGWVASLIAGGALIWGGSTLVYEILRKTGVTNSISKWIGSEFLDPSYVMTLALGVDGFQDQLAAKFDMFSNGSLGKFIRDDESIEESNSPGDFKVDSAAADEAIKDFIKSDPKLVKAFRDGKKKLAAKKD
jgi:hypothetical protein|tara:strand:+ start:112 stop:1317 length:1206 start_codon:yes stop_codon:yes gene_type:complete